MLHSLILTCVSPFPVSSDKFTCPLVIFFEQVLPSLQPVIVYFPDSSQWLSRAVPKSNRREFVQRVDEMFDQLTGPVVMICGQNILAAVSKDKDKEPVSFRILIGYLKLIKYFLYSFLLWNVQPTLMFQNLSRVLVIYRHFSIHTCLFSGTFYL